MLTIPVSILPVTTVPLPEIVNTSSIGIKKAPSTGLSGSGTYVSRVSISLVTAGTPISDVSPSKAFNALPTIIGVSSPGKSYSFKRSLISISTSSCSSGSSTWSALFINTTMYGTPTCLAKRICSLV